MFAWPDRKCQKWNSTNLSQNEVKKGLLFALAGFVTLAAGDVVIKQIALLWPGPAIAALRYSLAAVGLSAVILLKSGQRGFTMPMPAAQIGRGVSVACATLCFFSSLRYLPISVATSITFVSPMITALFSSIFLGERASGKTWAAIVVAFTGVIIILRPEIARVGPAAMLPLGGAASMAALFIFNRKVAGTAPVLVQQWLAAIIAAPILIVASLVLDKSGASWAQISWPSPHVILNCSIVAFSATCAHLLVFRSTEFAPATLTSPMTYVQILVALAAGWMMFGDVPDVLSIIGVSIIIGSGLFLWKSSARR
jgi:drug/metabolite transporter (DMT)-like permease